jgi:CRP/FNR family transcriptional regulator, transcriptional activator FtrB
MQRGDTVAMPPTASAPNFHTQRASRSRTQRAVSVDFRDLRGIRLFADLSDDRLQRLAETASQRQLAPCMMVIEEGTACGAVYVPLEGTLEVFSGFDDEEMVIDVVHAGAVVLLGAVIAELPCVASVRTLSAGRILVIPAAAIRELFDDDRTFARAVAWELSRCCYGMLAALKSLKQHSSMERLADWLLLPCGKRTLASLLGMTPECLSRSLRILADRGVVTMRGRDAKILNKGALSAIIGAVESTANVIPERLARRPATRKES